VGTHPAEGFRAGRAGLELSEIDDLHALQKSELGHVRGHEASLVLSAFYAASGTCSSSSGDCERCTLPARSASTGLRRLSVLTRTPRLSCNVQSSSSTARTGTSAT